MFGRISRTVLVLILASVSCCCRPSGSSPKKSAEADSLINTPFTFPTLKNYSDDFASIGTILDASSSCPLQRENIADSSFCFLRTIIYDGLQINVFSFDVIQGGTAEYIVTNGQFPLRNGIAVGSTIQELIEKLNEPYLIKGNRYIWRSSDAHNYLVFTIEGDRVSAIRWHEERQPEYKGRVVWETKYE